MIPSIKIPTYLARRPRDARGYPIPYVVQQPRGEAPRFPVVDLDAWRVCVTQRRCALCAREFRGAISTIDGCLITEGVYFIGGPICADNRLFFDPAMCEACARYAIRVCPYLALPSYNRTRGPEAFEGTRHAPSQVVEVASASVKRPARFMLGRAPGYTVRHINGDKLVLARPWLELEWWACGERVE